MSARRTRGQAIVEATLGILVFITIFLFGMHFAEVTFTEMKVTEAAQAAVWDSTSGQMHVLPRLTGNFTDVNARVSAARADVNTRYQNFDGRTSSTRVAPTGILSRARPGSMNVTCNVGAGLPQKGAGLLLTLHEALVYDDNDGMRCNAEAYVDSFGTFTGGVGNFLEGANGFFNKSSNQGASHKQSATQSSGYHACAVNKPNGFNGPCRGEFAMLIDDWGLASGGQEEEVCPVVPYGIPCPSNLNYWMSGNLMYQLNSLIFFTQNRAEYNLARVVGNPPFFVWNGIPFIPGNPTSFYMNFCGEFPAFLNCLGMFTSINPWFGDGAWWIWQTTPFGLYFPTYVAAYATSSGCYLGQECSASSITQP